MNADLGFALRRLRRSPWFTLFAVVTLSLAIGVTTAVYSLVRTGLRPFIKLTGADRLLVVTGATLRMPRPAPMSWLDYQDVASQVTAFDGVAAWTPLTAALSVDGRAEFAMAELVSGNYFAVVAGAAWRGRVLDSKDADPASPPVAVISTSAWRSRMHADPGAIGRTIKLDGHQFQIVGIMPDEFRGIDRPRGIGRPDVWMPLSAAPLLAHRYARQDRSRRDHEWLSVAGRLSPNAERAAAIVAVEFLSQQLDASEPLPPTRLLGAGTSPRSRGWTAYGVNDPIDFTQEKSLLRMVLLLPTLVLLIACSNLANFALSRGIARQNELAVRQALGASRWRLVGAQLLEYGVISLAGAVGGVLIAMWLLDRIAVTTERVAGTMPQVRLEAYIDGPVLVAVAGAALLSVLLAGLLPAWRLTGRGLRSAIDTDHPTTSLPRWRGRGNLIALQVSVSLALLLVSALVVRQIPKLKATAASGMSLDRIAVVTIPLSGELTRRDAIQRVLDDTADRVGKLPGATSVTYASSRKFTEYAAIGLAGSSLRNDHSQPKTRVLPVAADYFETVGLSVVAGRAIGPGDTVSAERVVVLNASLARALFGGRDAIGERVAIGNEVGAAFRGEPPVRTLLVVGVTSDTCASNGSADAFAYLPFAQSFPDQVELLAAARDDVDPETMAYVMRDQLHRVDPDVAVSFTGRADAADFGPKAMLQLFVVWFGTLAVLALGFAMSGLYGVLSHIVALRTRELGLRAALGADRRQLIALVLKDGARPVLEGVVIGFGIAAGARLGMQPWFEDPVTAVDPLALAIALVPLLAASWLACYLPARRAAAADPNVALKHL